MLRATILIWAGLWAGAVLAQPKGDRDDDSTTESSSAKLVDQDFLGETSLPGPGFHNDSELGFVESQGNSNAQSTNLTQMDSLNWSGNTLTGNYDFLRSESNGVESARRWDTGLLFQRDLSEDFGAYVFQGFESDKYAGFTLRSNSEAGGRYNLAKKKSWNWLQYVGYRYTVEQRVDSPHVISNEAHIYNEINVQWNRSLFTQVWADYLPNFTHNRDYLINAEGSLSTMMTHMLSLKTSYLIKYSNQPPPRATHQRDALLTTALVARF